MGGICYKKNQERGLWFEIKCIQETLNNPDISESLRKKCKQLLRSYKKYAEKDYTNGIGAREKSNSDGVKT